LTCLLSAYLGSVARLWSPVFERYCTLLTVSVLWQINPLNAQLNPICHLHALLGAHHIFRVSELRVNQPANHRAKWDNGKKILMFNTKLSDAKCNTKCETVCSLNSRAIPHIMVTRECGLSHRRSAAPFARPVAERRCTGTHTQNLWTEEQILRPNTV